MDDFLGQSSHLGGTSSDLCILIFDEKLILAVIWNIERNMDENDEKKDFDGVLCNIYYIIRWIFPSFA